MSDAILKYYSYKRKLYKALINGDTKSIQKLKNKKPQWYESVVEGYYEALKLEGDRAE